MAALSPSQTYSNESINLIRLFCIHRTVVTKVFHFIFKIGSSVRPQQVSLLDFYRSNGITGFANNMPADQKRKINADPEGTSFDITLLHRCLRNGSHGLAPHNDEKWTKRDMASIESCLYIAKTKRNCFTHDQDTFNNQQLIDEADELKDLLIKILNFTGQIFHIPAVTIDQEIVEVETNIRNYLNDDFEPKTFEEYREQLLFESLSKYLNNKGVKDVLKQYDNSFEGEVSTGNHLVNISVPLNVVYTEMWLERLLASGQVQAIMFEDVLLDENQKETDAIIVIRGEAGVGKTTLTKKFIYEWKAKNRTVKYLATYDHLIKAECRNFVISSFEKLLFYLMPTASKLFKSDDLKRVMLSQKVLVILDGLDELNESSSLLFEDVLTLKEKYGITVVITSRPEKVEYIKQKGRLHNIKMKHVQLLGVPTEKRTELVRKYHQEIAKKNPGTKDIKELLDYLKKTEYRLANLWRLPYNLTSLTVLWALGRMDRGSISTAPELYWAILELHKHRLRIRLQSNESTKCLNESELNKIIDFFLGNLGRESLIGLKNNQIDLSEEAYQRLEEVCRRLQVPVGEMIGAFLKRISSTVIIYSYHHKGFQDFLAALYIWYEITGKDHKHDVEDVLDGIAAVLRQKNIPLHMSQNILRVTKAELKKTAQSKGGFVKRTSEKLLPSLRATSAIHNILEEIHKPSKYDLPKFQHMLICLLGMFYLQKDEIDESTKLDTLKLLQGTGVRDRDDWINILNSVKCDEYVSSFISKKPMILDGHIRITDSNVSAYISLMKALKPPLSNAHKVKIDVNIQGDLIDSQELLQLINSYQFKLKRILINDSNFKEYTSMLKALKTPLVEAHKVELDIHVNECLSNIRELINQVERNKFTVRTLQVRDFEINNSNLHDYISIFKSLPCILDNGNKPSVDIHIKGDLTGADELLNKISSHHFKVRRLLITECNYIRYTAMLKALTGFLNDSYTVEIDLHVNEDLLSTRLLISLLERNHYTIRTLRMRDLEINDANVTAYISMFKSLPHLMDNANKVSVDIVIEGCLPASDELLELISIHQFQVKRFLINEKNCKSYTRMLEALERPLKAGIGIEICMYECDTNVIRLMNEIGRKKFSITKYEVSHYHIDDSHFMACIAILKSFFLRFQKEIKPSADIVIMGELTNADEISRLISIPQLKVKRIMITNNNFRQYTALLKDLVLPLKDSHEVNIDIQVEVDLTEITELLKQIKKKMFHVRSLKVKNDMIKITDLNLSEHIDVLACMPTLEKSVYHGSICIDIKGDLTNVDKLLKLISIHKFNNKIILITDENFKNYTSLLEGLETPFKDDHNVNIDIQVKIDMPAITELLIQIKKQGFQVRKLIVKEKNIWINDSNVSEYIRVIESLSIIKNYAISLSINIDIKIELTYVDKLLKLISIHKFEEKNILIDDKNFREYTTVLQGIQEPLHDAYKVNIDIQVNEELPMITELLNQIKTQGFKLRNLKLTNSKITIDDSNIFTYTETIEALPKLREGVFEDIEINILAGRTAIYLLNLINVHKFKEVNILINDQNLAIYDRDLGNLTKCLHHTVNIDIKVSVGLRDLEFLLKNIDDSNILIRKLRLYGPQVEVNSYNIMDYYRVFQALPTVMNDAYDGEIVIDLANDTLVITDILKDIGRNNFAVIIKHIHEFQRPTNISNVPVHLENALKLVFKRRLVRQYYGRFIPQISISSSVKDLAVSIPDIKSYKALLKLLSKDNQPDYLYISMSLKIDDGQLKPLPDYLNNSPVLFLPDVSTQEDAQKAISFAKKLIPRTHQNSLAFKYVLFPRMSMANEERSDFIGRFAGEVEIREKIIIPESQYTPDLFMSKVTWGDYGKDLYNLRSW